MIQEGGTECDDEVRCGCTAEVGNAVMSGVCKSGVRKRWMGACLDTRMS